MSDVYYSMQVYRGLMDADDKLPMSATKESEQLIDGISVELLIDNKILHFN